jgi:hypothetical protein
MQTQTMVESKACGLDLYSTPHNGKLRTYEHSTINNNFGYIIEEPHPNPPQRGGNSQETPSPLGRVRVGFYSKKPIYTKFLFHCSKELCDSQKNSKNHETFFLFMTLNT